MTAALKEVRFDAHDGRRDILKNDVRGRHFDADFSWRRDD